MEKNKNSLEQHKRSDGVKWVATLLAILLLGVFVAAACTQGFTNGDPWGWFKETEAPQSPQASVVDGNGNELADGKVHPMPTSMVFAMASAADNTSSVTVEATVQPDNATNKALDWSVAWEEGDNAWATGKTVTDYVTVTPLSDGATTATVKNIAAFGTQVIVTATSRDNPSVKATCSVDYLQRIESVSLKIGEKEVVLGGDTDVKVLIGKTTGGEGGTITLTKTLSSVYTVAETYTEKVSFTGGGRSSHSADDDYVSFGQAGSMGSMSEVYYDDLEDAAGHEMYFDRRLFSDYNFTAFSSSFVTGETHSSTTPFSEMAAETIGMLYFENRKGKKLWDITVTFTGTHKTFTYESALRLKEFDATVPVGGMTLDPSTILF